MFGTEPAGATLSFVTRRVKGEVFTEKTLFNDETQKIEKKHVAIENPVIVFLPSGSVLLFTEEEAAARGLMEMPEVLNIEDVNDTKTAAGKWKFAMNDAQRRKSWEIMEHAVIRACTARGGYPLDATKAKYSESSILFEDAKPMKKESVQ